MVEPFTNYIVELLGRIDSKYDALVDQMNRFEMELKTVHELIKKREDERKYHEKLVFDMLLSRLGLSKKPKCSSDGTPDLSCKTNNVISRGKVEDKRNQEGLISSNEFGEKTNLRSGGTSLINIDNSWKSDLVKEQSTTVHNIRYGENNQLVKCCNLQVEPSLQSFVVGGINKIIKSTSKVHIKCSFYIFHIDK